MTGMRRYGSVRPWMVLLLLGALLVAGCSTGNENSGLNLVDAQGKHPPGFLSTHPAVALPDGGICKDCHGGDLRGGISNVSCFSASRNGVGCHANGPAFHPATWLDKAAGAGFHGAAYAGNALIRGLACTVCHEPATPSYNCLSCHFNEGGTQRVPAGSAYIHGSIGGHAAFGPLDAPNATTSVCINCHATNNRFGHMPQPFCHNCHSPAPPSYHPAGWGSPDSHGPAAKAAPSLSSGLENCRSCHGSNFSGGSVGISCFTCHNVNAPHSPRPWRISAGSARTHTNANGGNAPTCFLCHAGGLLSSQPPPPPPPAGTPPGCFNNTLCHGAVGHATPFLDPDHLGVTQSEFDNVVTGCARCHAVSGASPVSGAPACQVCHTAGSPLSPTLNFGVCTSCHGGNAGDPLTTGPDGTAYPNVAGAHAKHRALNSAGTPVFCDTCHDGLGFVTLAHYNRANARPGLNALRVPPGDLAFDGTYDAATGASSFDNVTSSATFLTCGNVSCHGGQVAPNWQTGTLDVGTQCASCHAFGTTQFNSYNSGAHGFHVNQASVGCTACHNAGTLALNHFTSLATAVMEGPASATIGGGTTMVASYVAGSCTPTVGAPACHATRSW